MALAVLALNPTGAKWSLPPGYDTGVSPLQARAGIPWMNPSGSDPSRDLYLSKTKKKGKKEER